MILILIPIPILILIHISLPILMHILILILIPVFSKPQKRKVVWYYLAPTTFFKVKSYSCMWWWKGIKCSQRHLNQTQIFFNVNITTRGIVNLAFNVGINTTMKYVKRKFARQKNVRPDILKHVKMQKNVNFIKTIVAHNEANDKKQDILGDELSPKRGYL